MGALVPPTALDDPAPGKGDGMMAVEKVEQQLEGRLAALAGTFAAT